MCLFCCFFLNSLHEDNTCITWKKRKKERKKKKEEEDKNDSRQRETCEIYTKNLVGLDGND